MVLMLDEIAKALSDVGVDLFYVMYCGFPGLESAVVSTDGENYDVGIVVVRCDGDVKYRVNERFWAAGQYDFRRVGEFDECAAAARTLAACIAENKEGL